MKIFFITLLLLVSMVMCPGFSRADVKIVGNEVVSGIPVKNTVTLVDLGAKTCLPCKMMAPILEELKKEYKNRVEVIFIDVWDQSNKSKARAFRVKAIPTQIFYDKHGIEVYRHVGFLDKDSIIGKLEQLLAQ